MKSRFYILLVIFSVALLAERPAAQDGQLNASVRLQNATAINSEGYDFSPAFYKDGLVFVSSRRKNGPVDEQLGETFFELFYARLDPNGEPLRPSSFSLRVNSKVHEGPVTFNADNSVMYFTRNNFIKGVQGADSDQKVRMKIYQAAQGMMDWDDVQELPFNSNEYDCRHPSISPDGRMIYFSSDMPGGKGGFDIWVVLRQGDGWSDPINMGGKINTPDNEGFPFMHNSGTLFFSSNGHEGYGRLDLFMIDLAGGYFGEAINLGKPFNSERDDLGIVLNADGTQGYFASNRPGGFGKDDIYFFEAPDGIQGVEFPDLTTATVSVYSDYTGRGIDGAALRVYERVVDEQGEETLYKLGIAESDDEAAPLRLRREAIKSGETSEPTAITSNGGKAYVTLDLSKQYVLLVDKAGFASEQVPYTPADNTYNRPVEVPLSSDNCITLSGLVENSYGKPLSKATVHVKNGCTQRLSTLSSNANGTFQTCIEKGCDFEITANLPGYQRQSRTISTQDLRGKRSFAVRLQLPPSASSAGGAAAASDTVDKRINTVVRSGGLRASNIKAGQTVILGDIYYDFGETAIREGAAGSLDELAQMMKEDPVMEIELIAHTDCQGSETFNLRLSLERAENAKAYLIEKGVAPKRIRAFGYGETQPVNDCDCSEEEDCTDEEYEENRRTELKVLRKGG
ncbi:MAG: OmpA family protein [Bacteroidetes bacterium]|jgi:outer membrane protein OmpA-like peptidoglycan-associated protein|nr:OmpA family protein [Bacteroidota bacterium]